MKKILLVLTAMTFGLSLNANACEKFLEGDYLCVSKDGSYGTKNVAYETINGVMHFVYGGTDGIKLPLNGSPITVTEDGQLLNVVGSCSEDKKTIIVDINVYGTDSFVGKLTFTQTYSPGMNYKAVYAEKGEDEEEFCYRKF